MKVNIAFDAESGEPDFAGKYESWDVAEDVEVDAETLERWRRLRADWEVVKAEMTEASRQPGVRRIHNSSYQDPDGTWHEWEPFAIRSRTRKVVP